MGPHFYASLRLTQLEDQGLEDPTDEWINGLKDRYRLILVDYPRGMGQTPSPIGLDMTPDRLVQEYELETCRKWKVLRSVESSRTNLSGFMNH